MLDLGLPRSDLAQLTDEELLDRGNAALDAYEIFEKTNGIFGFLSWKPRALVKDPHEFTYLIHVLCEIRDIRDEMERRVASRRPGQNAPE
jgi:hypothetical protein